MMIAAVMLVATSVNAQNGYDESEHEIRQTLLA